MAYCSRCGYDYAEGIGDCPDCGLMLITGDRVTCPACGEEIIQEAGTCPHCGVLLGWSSEAEITCEVHPDAEAVGRCVVCGIPLCTVCARTRQGKLFCSTHDDLKVAFHWASAGSSSTTFEATFLKAMLESAQIPVMLLSQNDRMYTMTLGDLAIAEVMVPIEFLERAREVVSAVRKREESTEIQP